MDNKNDTLEFDLEDILNEFHDDSSLEPGDAQTQVLPDLSAEITDLIADLPDLTSDLPELKLPEQKEESAPAEASGEDTLQEVLTDATVRFDIAPDLSRLTEAEDTAASDAQPIPTTDTVAIPSLDGDTGVIPVLDADTTVIPDTHGSSEAPEQSAVPEEEFVAPAPIVFTPRSRLKELKKKLVAGPEKRYYELEGQGLGSLQVAILVCLSLVAVCAAITTMFSLDLMPENRLRLVIFSQVLAMLIGGLMSCNLMLDSLGDLLKGRFTVNTMLTVTFAACFVDGIFCLKELRVPCCAAFCLESTMALWARYHRHTTEMAQMDTMRKAVRLHGIVKVPNFYKGQSALLRTEAEVEDFMDRYNKITGPELVQNIFAALSLVVCMGIAVFAGIRNGLSMGIQIFSTSLLVAIPASFFVSITRPMALLETRLHMVGSVLCGWKGVKDLCGKAVFPLTDTDIFPQGSTKLNGVKFYSDRDPDEVVSYTASLIERAGGGLVPVFKQLLTSRNGSVYEVENFQNYGNGGIGGEVRGEPVLLGGLDFLRDMGVEIPEGTMVNQAVYASIDGQLCAVYAMTYAKMRSAAAGLVTLCGYRKLTPVMLLGDFTLTESFLRSKFNIKTRRMVFPTRDERAELSAIQPEEDARILAITTREELVSSAYLVTGARSVRTSTKLAVAIHLIGGIIGMLVMLALAILGNTELLTPTNILLYQLIWAVPGLLVTEWTRIV